MPNRVVWTFVGRDKFSNMAKRVKRAAKGVRTEFTKIQNVSKRMSTGLRSAAGSMLKFSAAAAIAVAGSLKAFGDMEKGIANVLTLLDADEFAEFGARIDKLSIESLTKFGFKTDEVTEALFEVVSRLGANTRAFDAFEAAQQLAIGGVTDLVTAVIGIAGVMNAYSDEMLDSAKVGNAFFASQKKGATNVQKLASNVGAVASIARTAGLDFQELLATMAQLTTGSLSQEEATTALKGAITSLINPSKEAEAILRHFEVPVGLTEVKDAGIVETFRKLNELFRTNEKMVVKAIPNVRGFLAVTNLTDKSLDAILANIAKMKSTDFLSPAVATQMDTLNKVMDVLHGNITVVAIEIGEQLKPAFVALANVIKSGIDKFRGLSDGWKKFIAIALVVVSVLAPLMIGVAALIAIIGPGVAIMGSILATFVGWPIAIGLAAVALVAFVLSTKSKFQQIKDAWKSVQGFFGFGGNDQTLDVQGQAQIDAAYRAFIDVNVVGPKGAIESVKTRTTGNDSKLNLAVNMAESS